MSYKIYSLICATLTVGNNMITITNYHTAHIKNVVGLAYVLGIDRVIIGNDSIRGTSKDKDVLMLNKGIQEVELPFKVLAANGIDALKQKLNIAEDMEELVVNVVVGENEDIVETVQQILLSGIQNGVRINYGHECCHPAQLDDIPKRVRDTFNTVVQVPTGISDFLAQATKAFKGVASVIIKGNDEGVSLELKDPPGNVLTHQLQEGPAAEPFSNRYSLKILQTLFKLNPETLVIGDRGVLKSNVRGLDVFVGLMYKYFPTISGCDVDNRSANCIGLSKRRISIRTKALI